MNETLQFEFSKGRVVLILACAVLMAASLYGARVATGMLIRSVRPLKSVSTLETSNRALPEKTSASASMPAASNANNDTAGLTGLLVDVAAFSEPDRAQNLASMLKREGFGPVHTSSRSMSGSEIHYVRVGPFPAWEDASRVAEEINRSFDLHSSVIPAKAIP